MERVKRSLKWIQRQKERHGKECCANLGINENQPSTLSKSADVERDPAQVKTTDLPTFTYAPLKTPTSIRVIKILPSSDGVIRCKMKRLDLDHPSENHRQFLALSYTWENPITITENPVEGILKEEVCRTGPDAVSTLRTSSSRDTVATRAANHPYMFPKEHTSSAKNEPRIIEVNSRQMTIQENLYQFLQRYISTDFAPFPIWIDAICINQNDLSERAAQVQLMGRVFGSANLVISWLGPPDVFTEDAIDGLELIQDDLGDIPNHILMILPLVGYQKLGLARWFAVFALFQRSWFKRAWVVQEVILGRVEKVIVVHGDLVLPLTYFSIWADVLTKCGLYADVLALGRNLMAGNSHSDLSQQCRKLAEYYAEDRILPNPERAPVIEDQDCISFMRAIMEITFRSRMQGEKLHWERPPLLRVMGLFRNTDATDPRDKVIAMLNIVSDTNQLGIIPDYTVSAQHLYRRVTEAIMTNTKSLSILSHVQAPDDTRLSDLPGWVPDFSARLRAVPLDTGNDDVTFCASGTETEAWFKIHDDDTLELETIKVGGRIIQAGPLDSDVDDMLHGVLSTLLRMPLEYPSGERICGTDDDDDENNHDLELGLSFDRWTVNIGVDFDGIDSLVDAVRLDDVEESHNTHEDKKHFRDEKDSQSSNKPKANRKAAAQPSITTRIEALWRILVADSLPYAGQAFSPNPKYAFTHPAPPSIGDGFSIWIIVKLLEMAYLCRDLDLAQQQHEHFDKSLTTPANLHALSAVAMYAAVYRGAYYPLSSKSRNVKIPLRSNGINKLATDEKYNINRTYTFFPSAKRVKSLLQEACFSVAETPEQASSSSTSHEQDGTQAAVTGAWRDEALLAIPLGDLQKMMAFERRMKSVMQGRRLFTTASGLVGIGPRRLFSKGQRREETCTYEVHVVKGGKVPYIFANFGNGRYIMVGEAYVHGIMNGEVLEEMERAKGGCMLKWERIRLG